MSGVELLTAHIGQLRRQAEEKISGLEEELAHAQRDSIALRQCASAAQDEVQLCRGMIQQLRLENTQKWRIEEREDWKALVASIQSDRRQLQEENLALSKELALMREAAAAASASAAEAAAADAASSSAPGGAGQDTAETPSVPSSSKMAATGVGSSDELRRLEELQKSSETRRTAEWELLRAQLEQSRREADSLRSELAEQQQHLQRLQPSTWLRGIRGVVWWGSQHGHTASKPTARSRTAAALPDAPVLHV